VNWNSTQQYDSGYFPSIALTGDGTHVYAVEVHQSTLSCPGPLSYRVGLVTGNTVVWSGSSRYDTGCNPSVAISGGTVVEVHQTGTKPGPLFLHTGTLSFY
jgi:hypothetical protein